MNTEAYNEVMKLIKSNEFAERVKKGDQSLFEFFRNTENLKALIDVICNQDNYFHIKKIVSFFVSTDTSVTELFVTKLEIAEYAFLRVSEHLNYSPAMGTIASIYGRCFSAFPDTASDCFRRSTKILPIFVEMMKNASFHHVACEEASITPYKSIPHFIYRLFLTLCGEKIEKIKDFIPEYFTLFPEYTTPVPEDIDSTQFVNIVAVIKNYLQNIMKDGMIPFEIGLQCKTFEALIREYIKLEINQIDVSDIKNPKLALFDLASILKDDADIEKLALKFITASVSSPETPQAQTKYLAKFNSAITHTEIISLFKVTSEKSPRNIVLCLLIELFKAIFARTKDEKFVAEIGDVVKAAWNGSNRKMRTFFIEVLGSFEREIAAKVIGNNFVTKVITPYFSTEENASEVPDFNITVEQFI